ncbi:MAG TPA: hypothetical protein VFB21_12025 [Chthonomonadaceae bacterium]|nr:hypothetical protein [Chthonomonadaceae bacterium]
MFGIIFKLFAIAIGLVAVAYMAAQAFRNARRLDARIQQYKAEQEELEKQGKPFNPYAALAELYAEQMPSPQKEAESRNRKPSRRKRA